METCLFMCMLEDIELPDPGSLDQVHFCEPDTMPPVDENNINGDDDDLLREESDDNATQVVLPHLLYDSNFIPVNEDVALSAKFIRLLQQATLDNSTMTLEQLERLRNPPPHQLKIQDQSERYSLKVFMALTDAPDNTYAKI